MWLVVNCFQTLMEEMTKERVIAPEPSPEPVAAPAGRAAKMRVLNWKSAVMVVGSLLLFIIALGLMRDSARSLSFLLKELLIHQNFIHTLGLGWLASYLLLSGSPVAAAALTFLDSGALNQTQTFTMIVGTRFGAIFVTVFFGLLYYWEGTHTKKSLAVGVLAYLTTFWVALGSLLLGLLLLPVTHFDFRLPIQWTEGVDDVLKPIVSTVNHVLPPWTVFIAGLGLLMLSFKMVDLALPDLRKQEFHDHQKFVEMLHSPYAMFLLGVLVTLISPSVSVSCGLLVPLYAKGYIRASRLVPYVMGANIATFWDTLLAALVMKNPGGAVHVVMTVIISIALVSLAILVFGFSKYENLIERWTDYFTENPKRLSLFLVLIFFVPLVLLIV
jgi:Na+/phosphate symporter